MKAPRSKMMTPKVISECIAHIAVKATETVETSLASLGMNSGREVESPIELKLLMALSLKFQLELHGFMNVCTQDNMDMDHVGAELVAVIQHVMGNPGAEMRVDLAIFYGRDMSIAAAIECDGHDFHERTKEQAKKDRSRDRVIQSLGVPILRFTGSEIHNDPFGCADEILSFIFRP